MDTRQTVTRTTRSGQSYGRTTKTAQGSKRGESSKGPARNPDDDDGDDDEEDLDYEPTAERKFYTRKCKLTNVLQVNEYHRQIYIEQILRISKNYSCLHFDTMNFINFLMVCQFETSSEFIFNPTDVRHVACCLRLMIPGHVLSPSNHVQRNEPGLYQNILLVKQRFDQLGRDQGYVGINYGDTEERMYKFFAEAFAIKYTTNVKEHITQVWLYLRNAFIAYITCVRLEHPNPARRNDQLRTPKQIAGECVNYITDANNEVVNLAFYNESFGDEVGIIARDIHIIYVTIFGDDENRDISYVQDTDNIEETALPLLEFQAEILKLVERFRKRAIQLTREELRVKRWSLLPLPSNGMVHFRLSGPTLMYYFLLGICRKIDDVFGYNLIKDTLPFAIRSVGSARTLAEFKIVYRNQRPAIWDSLFHIAQKFGGNARQHFQNSIVTDGCDISFVFQKDTPTTNIIPITFKDHNVKIPRHVNIANWHFGLLHLRKEPTGIRADKRIIGIDPGHRDLIYCTSTGRGDFSGKEGKSQRKATTYSIGNKEYQFRRGLLRAQDLELGRREHEGIQVVYDQIVGSPKTVDYNDLLDNLQSQFSIRSRMIDFNHGLNHRETKFYLYSQRQIALTRIGQELMALGSKYTPEDHRNFYYNMECKLEVKGYLVRGSSFKAVRRKEWLSLRRLIQSDAAELPILSYGDKSLNPTMRGRAALPVKYIREFFSERTIAIMVDEFRTSQRCSQCGEALTALAPPPNVQETPEERIDRLNKTYPLKECLNCDTVWNRDYNASRNIAVILEEYIIEDCDINSRPEYLSRGNP